MILFSCLLFGCQEAPAAEPVQLDIPSNLGIYEDTITQSFTLEKKLALTFNGLGNKQQMNELLAILDMLQIKATFFIPGIAVRENADLLKQMIALGHEIENNTLNQIIPDSLSFEELYLEVYLANLTMQEQLGITPVYVRTRSGDSSVTLNTVAQQLGMHVVGNNINPLDTDKESSEEIVAYIQRFAHSGSIIQLDINHPSILETVKQIAQNMQEKGLQFDTLDNLVKADYIEENFEFNHFKFKTDLTDVKPRVIEQFDTTDRVVALTFDDWASEGLITEVLQILNSYEAKATFFLNGIGTEKMPQLAKMMYNEGHELANHTYSHPNLTESTVEEIQEEVIQADYYISRAIQQPAKSYFRPPFGYSTEREEKAVAAVGIDYIIMYDVATEDWNMEITVDDVVQNVIDNVEPGSIICMHILDKGHVLQALPRILAYLEQNQYQIKLLTDLIETYVKDEDERET